MSEDITPGLLKKIQDDFQENFDKSSVISDLYKKVRDGTATYKEANEFAIEVGDILAGAYRNNLSSAVLPNGKMYYNIAQRIIEPTMKRNYELITDVTNQVQTSLNKSAKIGIKAIQPKLNLDRVHGIVNKVSNAEVYDDVAWALDEPIKVFSQSIVDDAIKENAEFQYGSGLTPKIVRRMAGNCCDWCKEVAGIFKYPDVPKDVYRRHQRCRCTVEYDPGDGKRQNVHTKKWEEKVTADNIDYMGQAKVYEANMGEKKYAIKAYKNDNYDNIWCQTYSNNSQRMCEYLNNVVNSKYPGVKQIVVAKKNTLQGIAAYDHSKKTLFICEELIDNKKFFEIVDSNFFAAQNLDDILVHELGGHKSHWEAVERYYKDSECKSLDVAKQQLEYNLREYIVKQINMNPFYLRDVISENAYQQFAYKKILNEVIADGTILMDKGTLQDDYLAKLVNEVIAYDGNAK